VGEEDKAQRVGEASSIKFCVSCAGAKYSV
jgi:hypothetical protein